MGVDEATAAYHKACTEAWAVYGKARAEAISEAEAILEKARDEAIAVAKAIYKKSCDVAAEVKVLAARTIPEGDPRERAETKVPWSTLRSNEDWLALVFRHDFMDKAEMGTLLFREKWINDQYTDGKIPNQYYAPALAEIKHYKNNKK